MKMKNLCIEFFYLLLPLENDMMIPELSFLCRSVVENVKSGDRFIKSIARFTVAIGADKFRCGSSDYLFIYSFNYYYMDDFWLWLKNKFQMQMEIQWNQRRKTKHKMIIHNYPV